MRNTLFPTEYAWLKGNNVAKHNIMIAMAEQGKAGWPMLMSRCKQEVGEWVKRKKSLEEQSVLIRMSANMDLRMPRCRCRS